MSPQSGKDPLSIVIVTWNSSAVIGECLRSVEAGAGPRAFEVLLVDNASSDATIDVARDALPGERLRVIANRENRGLAAGNNQGLAAARHGTYVICNPDVVFCPGSLDELATCLDRHPRSAFAIAKLLHTDGSVQTSAGDLPTIVESLVGRRRGVSRRATRGVWWDGWPHDQERPVGHGAEACYAIRRAAVDEVGGQDEGYWLDWEGIDWSTRMHDAGWEIWFCPTATVTHIGGVSIRQRPLRWVVATHRGLYRYHSRRCPVVARPLLALVVALRAVAKCVLVLVSSRVYDRGRGR